MGSGADNRLNQRRLAQLAGQKFANEKFLDKAEDYALREGIPLDTALRLLSGKSTRSYGSPKPKA